MQLTPEQRLFPRWTSWAGLAACLFLAPWVETRIWLTGAGLIAVGLVWVEVTSRLRARRQSAA